MGPFLRLTSLLSAWPVAVAAFVSPVLAQKGTVEPPGQALYRQACAHCHGWDGTGARAALVALPIQPPDFTDSRFASREPEADWAGIVTLGGPIRGFDRWMPAFGEALKREEIDLILEYVQSFYPDKSWPRGEFNLPLAQATEKAFPEDEVVLRTAVSTGGQGALWNRLTYEKRFGSRNQLEISAPFGWKEVGRGLASASRWEGGVGDLAVGWKRVLWADLGVGSIGSFTLEAVLPTGNETKGFGNGHTVLEPFLTTGQLLEWDAFAQLQTGLELPLGGGGGEKEGFLRLAVGRTFTAGGEWGRAFSPMMEFLGSGELEGGAWKWDLLPQVHFTLNRRQHVMANVGVRLPLIEREGRRPQLVFLVLWDWFDGGLLEGW